MKFHRPLAAVLAKHFLICIIFSLFLTQTAQHLHLLARSKEMNAAVHTCTLCRSAAAIDKKENRDFHNNNGHRIANCAFATCMLIAVKEAAGRWVVWGREMLNLGSDWTIGNKVNFQLFLKVWNFIKKNRHKSMQQSSAGDSNLRFRISLPIDSSESLLQVFLQLINGCLLLTWKTWLKLVYHSSQLRLKTVFSRNSLVNKWSLYKAMLMKYLPILFLLTFATEVLLTSTSSRLKRENAPDCGIPSKITSLVISGSDFERGTWPWMVPLLAKTSSPPKLFCGGVLVSLTKVLTGENRWDSTS